MERTDFDTDVAIVGSGFGGSVAALRLTEKGYRVTVLEKGRRWRPEEFPRTNWNLRRQFWFPGIGCYGTWALHLLREALVLHGVGVGGGSLNYANTHYDPPETVWDDPQWKELVDWRREMPGFYAEARRMLGTTDDHPVWPADEALQRISESRGRGSSYSRTPVGVYFGDPDTEVPDPFFGARAPRAGAARSVAPAWWGAGTVARTPSTRTTSGSPRNVVRGSFPRPWWNSWSRSRAAGTASSGAGRPNVCSPSAAPSRPGRSFSPGACWARCRSS